MTLDCRAQQLHTNRNRNWDLERLEVTFSSRCKVGWKISGIVVRSGEERALRFGE